MVPPFGPSTGGGRNFCNLSSSNDKLSHCGLALVSPTAASSSPPRSASLTSPPSAPANLYTARLRNLYTDWGVLYCLDGRKPLFTRGYQKPWRFRPIYSTTILDFTWKQHFVPPDRKRNQKILESLCRLLPNTFKALREKQKTTTSFSALVVLYSELSFVVFLSFFQLLGLLVFSACRLIFRCLQILLYFGVYFLRFFAGLVLQLLNLIVRTLQFLLICLASAATEPSKVALLPMAAVKRTALITTTTSYMHLSRLAYRLDYFLQ